MMDRVDYQSLIVQDLLNDYRDKKLNLNPWYQRRSVWTKPQKSYLLNTIFERKPIPAIYIRHGIDLREERSIKEVVDGQQRCRSIIEYRNDVFSARSSVDAPRKLFSELSIAEREKFLLTPLPVGYLLGANDADVIDIFARINSVSKSLNPQEKRNAKYSGEFKQFSLRFATSNLPFWRAAEIFSANDIARMNEVFFVSDLIFNLVNGLSDYRPSAIDAFYRDNEEEFPQSRDVAERLNRLFDVFVEMDPAVFKNTIFSRQPIFFSLVICLDRKMGALRADRLTERMFELDAVFRDELNQEEQVIAFRNSVSASTQRIASRRKRQEFLDERL
ncbi:DUF262 domain-containing protein [Roseibium aggregatum]|uniref:DUF262 domain-containing protein n=1 Tax=Roseibium aggregatum TaxID=187304 RepID=UPI001E2AF7EF|nr:DUF262 domain-containing protein [Roseibium aggregatum]UES50964.1 DUF262 domain-containing protein [Roseibium aggregatum]